MNAVPSLMRGVGFRIDRITGKHLLTEPDKDGTVKAHLHASLASVCRIIASTPPLQLLRPSVRSP